MGNLCKICTGWADNVFEVDWKILRLDGKGKKVMLKCGCGIY